MQVRSIRAQYTLYDKIVRIPEAGVGNVTFSILSEPTMDTKKSTKRPLVILTAIFLVAVVITGVVVWKVTKDAYESSSDDVRVIKGSESKEGQGEGKDAGEAGGDGASEPKTYTAEEVRAQPWLSLRMLRDVLPVHYDITMYPDFYGNGTMFYGNETVELKIHRATRFVLIHIHGSYINVTSSSLRDTVSGHEIDVTRAFYYARHEFWIVEASRELKPDEPVSLELSFEGSLVKGNVGIYKSTYLNTKTNETRHIVSSKFEPTYARRAFPCFDEPNIKAEYTITLVHHPDYTALSNMPTDGQPMPNAEHPGLVSTKFERSVKMSTYLVCYIVCDFQYKETISKSGKPVRVYATTDKIDQVQFSLDLAAHTLDHYEDLFNMSYPLPKQDLIAIPDFVSGAMEHWGLITFRESRLLVDSKKSSRGNMESVAITVAHEMAHMWFGNIVTMDWWNDLWLNEGFASYMTYLGVASKYPNWDILDIFLTEDLFPVMKQDSELSSHPIIVDLERPSQITSVFDLISYSKGSSVIRMLYALMGEENFFKGISSYLKRFKWMNAKTDDLWQSLSEVTVGDSNHYDVKHIMDTWTLQDGFPYVSISVVTSDSGESTVTATQERFMSNPEVKVDPSTSPLGYKWYIALAYNSSRGDAGVEMMDKTDITFQCKLGLEQPGSWVKFNLDQTGFYRVLYPETMWSAFARYLASNDRSTWSLSPSDRAGLLNDAFSLAAAGLVSYQVPLELMTYLSRERHHVPWTAANQGGISYIHTMLQKDRDFQLWRKFLLEQVQPAVADIGFSESLSQDYVNLRPVLVSLACKTEDKATLKYISEEFRDWLDNGTVPTNVNLRSLVYSNGLVHTGSVSDWEALWRKYQVESSPSEKERIVAALAQARQPDMIMRLLEYAKEGVHIRRQDFFTVIYQVGKNPAASDMLWTWTRDNYQAFVDRFTTTHRYFGRMVYYMVRDYNTRVQLREVKALFERFPEAGASERYRRMAVESIEKNIYWMDNFRPTIVSWLKNRTR